MRAWSKLVIKGTLKLGVDLRVAIQMPEMLQTAGFIDIRSSLSHWPIGAWQEKKKKRRLASYMTAYWIETLEAARRPFRTLGLQYENTEALLALARSEIHAGRIRATMAVHTIWARKPRRVQYAE